MNPNDVSVGNGGQAIWIGGPGGGGGGGDATWFGGGGQWFSDGEWLGGGGSCGGGGGDLCGAICVPGSEGGLPSPGRIVSYCLGSTDITGPLVPVCPF